jgi:hypothetical protein
MIITVFNLIGIITSMSKNIMPSLNVYNTHLFTMGNYFVKGYANYTSEHDQ